MEQRILLPKKFFAAEETRIIMQAIQRAETNTSGEIRLHLAKNVSGNIIDQAKKVFEKIGMTNTTERNGVLIFFALKNKQFAVLGDQGINEKVGAAFWDDVCALMQQHFQQGDFVRGLSQGIESIGHKLKDFFPYQSDDVNELSDDLSYEE